MGTRMKIVAMSSGTLTGELQGTLLNDFILGLARTSRPKVCFIPTATGDSADYVVAFYNSFRSGKCEPSHLMLFNRTIKDLRSFILDQDVICVAGGNTANMLAVWRTHGLDSILHQAWLNGIILCGWSAGALCWFESGSTDSFGHDLSAIDNCLGFLPGSFCPHYDSEDRRRSTYHRFIDEGLAGGWACEDGTALHFEGTELRRVVSSREGAKVYRVEKVDGEVRESRIDSEPLW
jgi:dipeptidase E